MSHSILDYKKGRYIIILLAIILIALSVLFLFRYQKEKPQLYGNWSCLDDPKISLTIEPETISIGQLSFPYELSLPIVDLPTRQQPQGFVLDGGSMGIFYGTLFFEEDCLYLEIDSQTRSFSRSDS